MADGLKDRNLQDYYESLQTMFATKGWEYLAEDLMALYNAANTLAGIKTQSDLDFRLGQVDILAKITAQPTVVSAAYDMLLEDEK